MGCKLKRKTSYISMQHGNVNLNAITKMLLNALLHPSLLLPHTATAWEPDDDHCLWWCNITCADRAISQAVWVIAARPVVRSTLQENLKNAGTPSKSSQCSIPLQTPAIWASHSAFLLLQGMLKFWLSKTSQLIVSVSVCVCIYVCERHEVWSVVGSVQMWNYISPAQ